MPTRDDRCVAARPLRDAAGLGARGRLQRGEAGRAAPAGFRHGPGGWPAGQGDRGSPASGRGDRLDRCAAAVRDHRRGRPVHAGNVSQGRRGPGGPLSGQPLLARPAARSAGPRQPVGGCLRPGCGPGLEVTISRGQNELRLSRSRRPPLPVARRRGARGPAKIETVWVDRPLESRDPGGTSRDDRTTGDPARDSDPRGDRTTTPGPFGRERPVVRSRDMGREAGPRARPRVQIRAGHTVIYDGSGGGPIRSIHVAGTWNSPATATPGSTSA